MSTQLRYWVFISYSTADAAWAAWLRGALGDFDLNALGQHASIAEAARLQKSIWVDRKEGAPIEPDPSVRQALSASQYLIVIASPDAAQSAPMAGEIEWFIAQRGVRHLLALVVAGRPNAAQRGYAPEEECFPEALRMRVPADEVLAADVRGSRSRRDALFRLVAGLTGTDYSVLRLWQRRRRRTLLVAAAALGLSAIAAAVPLLYRSGPFGTWAALPVPVAIAPFAVENPSAADDFLALVSFRAAVDAIGRRQSIVIAADSTPDLPPVRLSALLRQESGEPVLELTIHDARDPRHPSSTTEAIRGSLAKSLDLGYAVPATVIRALHIVEPPDTPATRWRLKLGRQSYVTGRYLWLRQAPGDLKAARQALRDSTSANAADAEAWATLALADVDMAAATPSVRELAAEARVAAQRALALDPEISDAKIVLAKLATPPPD